VHCIKTQSELLSQFALLSMPIAVSVPKATITLEEAEILSWRKQEGEYVRKDDVLFEMETDKVVVEVPSPADGFLLHIGVKRGIAHVDQIIAWLGEQGEAVPENHPVPDKQPVIAGSRALEFGTNRDSSVPMASPAAKRRARELGLTLSGIHGSGPGGRITEADVERMGRRS
jgi:pyruvate/2-oxoglutarate dehydrogenase complex dihydrolipoamide acyltransferase (E2) component